MFNKKREAKRAEPTLSNTSSTMPAEPLEGSVEQSRRTGGYWHSYRPDSDIAVVFVHGFLSDSADCWTNPNGAFWPDLVTADERLPSTSVFLGGYHTGFDSISYDIKDCANELRSSLTVKRIGGHRAVTDFPVIVFVCHSLGGIVTRYLIDTNRKLFKGKTLGLALVASPSLGSGYANALAIFGMLARNKIARQLQTASELIVDLDERFRVMLEEADPDEFTIVGAEAVEDWSIAHCWATLWIPPIVKAHSASRYFGGATKIAKSTHSSIAKPDSYYHASHRFLVNFLNGKLDRVLGLNKYGSKAKNSKHLSKASQGSKPEQDVLFDVYNAGCEPYFLIRNIDSLVSDALDVTSVWIYGQSGFGKTSVLRRYFDHVDDLLISITLSHYAKSLSTADCITEVSDTLAQLDLVEPDTRITTVTVLAASLAKLNSPSRVTVFFDEVPIGTDSAMNQVFVDFVSQLLMVLKERAGAQVRIAIASIGNPKQKEIVMNEKFLEHIRFKEVLPWTFNEMFALYNKILGYSPNLAIGDGEMLNQVLTAANGSPRFLKSFLKNKLIGVRGHETDAELLKLTVTQFNRG